MVKLQGICFRSIYKQLWAEGHIETLEVVIVRRFVLVVINCHVIGNGGVGRQPADLEPLVACTGAVHHRSVTRYVEDDVSEG